MAEIDIRRIAKLSRLHIEDSEVEKLEREMSGIVGMVEKLPEFSDTKLPLDAKDRMPLREDEVGTSMKREKILQNAPKTEAGCVVVPRVVE